MKLLQFYVDDIIRTALNEDINYIDSTTDLLIDPADRSEAYFVAKASGVVAGLDVALRVFELLDSSIEITRHFSDGDAVKKGDIIAEFKGNTAALLKGERTALNLLQHMSGIASYTALCVEKTKGTNASICDTRKTLPGLRALQKYSVVMGGGRNHRYNLTDAAMLKDNHIDAYGSITGAVSALKKKIGHMAKRSTRAKLLSYLSEETKRQNSSHFTIPFTRQQLADFLCVDRSAMSNELCKMRDEGLLQFDKNQFTLR